MQKLPIKKKSEKFKLNEEEKYSKFYFNKNIIKKFGSIASKPNQ
jgi:hypothetical protein